LDANALKSNDDFDKLRDAYVIFITENDVMGEARDYYSYQRRDDKTGKRTDIYHAEAQRGRVLRDYVA